jgi:hypothetical protein
MGLLCEVDDKKMRLDLVCTVVVYWQDRVLVEREEVGCEGRGESAALLDREVRAGV